MRRALMGWTAFLVLGGAMLSTACSGDDGDGNGGAAAPAATATATETAAPTAAATETAAPTATATPGEMAMDGAAPGEAGALLAALLVIDGAGFHAIDEALAVDGAVIEPAWLGLTQRARVAASAVEWPEALREQAEAFVAAAGDLEASLDADDAAAAAGLAGLAHETQHALGDDAYRYLVAADPGAESVGAMLAAIATIDGAGFHAIADALASDGATVDAAWLGATERARIAAIATAWPEAAVPPAHDFIAAAGALEAALAGDSAAAAREPAALAHDAQHALSHEVYHHLESGHAHGDDHADAHDDDEHEAAHHGGSGALLAALALLERAEFHAIDTALVADPGRIEPSWLGEVQRARTAVAAVDWPEDLSALAGEFVTEADRFIAALDADDAVAAAETVGATHTAYHLLSANAFAVLGAGDDDHDH